MSKPSGQIPRFYPMYTYVIYNGTILYYSLFGLMNEILRWNNYNSN